jgi:hypothetical protein
MGACHHMAMKMLRITAALFFLSACLSLSAQRMGGSVGGGAHAGGGAHFSAGHSSAGGFRGSINSGFRRRPINPGYGYGGYYWPIYGAYGGYWDAPWDYTEMGPDDQRYSQPPSNTAAPVVMMQSSQPQAPYVPPASPKLVEVPQDGPATAAKNLPPALFVLSSGERIETDRYMLSAKSLSVDVGRQQRTIPLTDVNIDATLAANHQRGLDLTIPQDSNSIVLGF